MKGSEIINLIENYNLEDYDFGVKLRDIDSEVEYETTFDGKSITINHSEETVFLSAEHSD